MKHATKLALCTSALAMFMTCSAFASYQIDVKGSGTFVQNGDKNEYTATYTGTKASNNRYLLLVVEGDKATLDSNKIVDIRQLDNATGDVKFDVKPKELKANTKYSVWIGADIGADGPVELAEFTTDDSAGGSEGGSVSGTAVSWNEKTDAVYALFSASTEDSAIRDGSASPAYTGVGGSVVAGESKGKLARYEQSFTFDGVEDGTYKLAITKPGKYVTRIVTVQITSGADLGKFDIYLYGDINNDGTPDGKDATQILRYGNLKGSMLDSGDANEQAAKLDAGNINKDTVKNSNKPLVDGKDATQILRFANLKGSMFDKLP